jgi:DNA adenine methylase Dam
MQTAIATPLKSPLKWLGSKTRLPAEQKGFIRHLSQGRRWVAPYCGGIGLELEIQPEEALLGDANYDLINFWSWVQSGLTITDSCKSVSEDDFYYYRDKFNYLSVESRIEEQGAARIFYMLNRYGFNGLVRYSKPPTRFQGAYYNVPYGKEEVRSVRTEFSDIQKVIASWCFVVGTYQDAEFSTLMSDNDFLFLDPPYVPEEGKTNAFTGYWPEPFGWEQQAELLEWAANQECPIVACNAWNLRLAEMYQAKGFEVQEIQVPRSISADGALRGKVSEMFAIRN